MKLRPTVASVINEHVTLELESIDRLYLNIFVPQLQREGGVAAFFRVHRGHPFASSALMDPISKEFVARLESFAKDQRVPVVQFRKGERKDDIAAEFIRKFKQEEGVLFIGKAQEKTRVFRTERRHNPKTGVAYPWLVRSTAMVNHYYIYGVDRDFGPFFLKFCTYFPYTAKLYLNGHEWLKQQLKQRGIGFESLDNGLSSCDDIKRAQAIADSLSAEKIDALLRKWLRRLPHPFTPSDRKAGYRYDISILQAEFSLTQVLEGSAVGRLFFEEVIGENLDIGRPSQAQLIFGRRINTRTPGRFRTRVITEGVIPSLHADYKSSRIKQYLKRLKQNSAAALRTETTINNTRDFGIGKRLKNLPELRQIGFRTNRRMLEVETVAHDCFIGQKAYEQVAHPVEKDGQRASGLRFDDPRAQALFSSLVLFGRHLNGFCHQQLRDHLAELQGLDPSTYRPGKVTYDLRRLRLHRMIVRIPGTNRYKVTSQGLRFAMFFNRTHARLLRPKLAEIVTPTLGSPSALRKAFDRVDQQIKHCCEEARLAA
jgi:hypothetical protein